MPHHPLKIVLIFSAMRHFALALRERGWQVHYVQLDDDGNSGTIVGELRRWQQALGATHIHLTECGEWRLEQALRDAALPLVWHRDTRFLCSRSCALGPGARPTAHGALLPWHAQAHRPAAGA